MPTISDYNSIPLSDGIKELFGNNNQCREVNSTPPDKMLVSANGKTYSIQELVTQAEAFQYLLKTPSKLEFLSNTVHANFLHHAPCGPLPELTESTMIGIAKGHGIQRATPEYTLLYIIQEYFSGLIDNKKKTELPSSDTLTAYEKSSQHIKAIQIMGAAMADVPDGSYVFKLTLAEAYLVLATLKNEPFP